LTSLPTGRSGQLLALGLLALAGAFVYVLVVAPLFDWYAERGAALQDRQALAIRLARVGGELPALRSEAARLRAAGPAGALTLDGGSDAIAAAGLQGRLEQLAAASGANIGSVEILQANPRGGYRRIGLRVSVSASYPTLVSLLQALDTATPPLIIDNLQIHGGIIPVGSQTRPKLTVGFELYGFRSNPTGPGKP
jgi:general secretion pathway protein M